MEQKIQITQDNSYQIMITKNSDLLIDCYFDTLEQAAAQFKTLINNFVATGITIELYFRYYYCYVDQDNKVVENCEHILIDKIAR